jgi:hypothetical protein
MLIHEFNVVDIPTLEFRRMAIPREIELLPAQNSQNVRVEIEGPRDLLKMLRFQQIGSAITFAYDAEGALLLHHQGSWLSIKSGEGTTVTQEAGELSISGAAQVMVDGKICAEDTPDPLAGQPLRIKVYAPQGTHLMIDMGPRCTLQSHVRLGDTKVIGGGNCKIEDMQGNLLVDTGSRAQTECHGIFTSVTIEAAGSSRVFTSGEVLKSYEANMGGGAKLAHLSPSNSSKASECILHAGGSAEISYESPQLASVSLDVGARGTAYIRSTVLGAYQYFVWGDGVLTQEGIIHGEIKRKQQHQGQFIHKESSDVSPSMIS